MRNAHRCDCGQNSTTTGLQRFHIGSSAGPSAGPTRVRASRPTLSAGRGSFQRLLRTLAHRAAAPLTPLTRSQKPKTTSKSIPGAERTMNTSWGRAG
jgi:hypothetical protein